MGLWGTYITDAFGLVIMEAINAWLGLGGLEAAGCWCTVNSPLTALFELKADIAFTCTYPANSPTPRLDPHCVISLWYITINPLKTPKNKTNCSLILSIL